MMKTIFIVLLAISTYSMASDVIELNKHNFDEIVLKNKVPVMVMFYAPWCGHCKNLEPTFSRLATSLKGILPIARVDCTVEEKLAGAYNIRGYPTLKLFHPNGKVEDYQGQRTLSQMSSFITDRVDSNVFRVTESNIDKYINKHSDIPHVLVFSKVDRTSTLLKSMSMRYNKNVIFGEVKKNEEAVKEKYGIKELPSIVLLKDDGEFEVYDGQMKPKDIEEYIKSIGKFDDGGNKPEDDKNKADKVEKKKKAFKQGSWEVCDKKKVCVILISDSDNVPQLMNQLTTLYGNERMFDFVHTKMDDQIKSKFNLDQHDDMVVIYHGKRSRYHILKSIESKEITSTLDKALGGNLIYENI